MASTSSVKKNKSNAQSPSVSIPGMGAVRLEKGVGFRVWAPHAETVHVIGSFNDWNAEKHPLQKDEHGFWAGAVPEAAEGDEYLFQIKNGDQVLKRVDPWARKVTNSVGNGIIWWPDVKASGPKFTLPSYNELVIYELHTGSFHAPQEGKPGDFKALIEKLPYLRDLGINAIEVMPIAEFAGDLSWGYNPAHPFAVETAYGGPEAFHELVKASHEHGIGVILDVVYNHFGPSDLSLWQFDGWNENGQGGIYFYNDWKAATPWGETRPDYGRNEVRGYIHDNAMMWLRDYGVDGLRLDMSVYIRTVNGNPGDDGNALSDGWDLLRWINDDVRKEFPGAITIAEDLQNSDALVKSTGDGGAGFGSQWDAGFVHPVRAAMIVSEDQHRDIDVIISALKHGYDNDAFKRVIYSESHDEVANGKARLPTEIAPNQEGGFFAKSRSTLGAVLVFTAPGIPMLFQGQEFLEDEWFRDNVPLDWKKLERFGGIHAMYRDLIALRRNAGGVTKGLMGQHIETHSVNHEKKVLGFRRWMEGGAGDDVVIVINLSAEALVDYSIGVPSAGLWKVRFNSAAKLYSEDFTDHASFDMEAIAEPYEGCSHRIIVGIGPYASVIYSQDASPA